MKNKWTVHYILNSDEKSLSTLQLLAHPAFNEKGRFSLEESKNVVKFIHSYPVPDFSNNLDKWESFREELNSKIFDLYGK